MSGSPRPGRLIGRDAELAVVERILVGLEDEGGAVVVRGRPGVGKTSVLRAGADLARARGALVLECSGTESEAMTPFAGLHRAVGPLLPQCGALPSVQRRALATAFGAESAASGAEPGPPPALFLTALAVLTLVVDAAKVRPVVLVADDVQWLDAPTVDVLAFVARRLQHDPVAVLAGVRDGHAVALDGAGAVELPLRGLDPDAARALLTTVAADLTAADQQSVLTHAQGNPLALLELPAALRSARVDVLSGASPTLPLTTRLERAFGARTRELPAVTRAALLVAAVDAEGRLAEVLAATTALTGTTATADDLEPALRSDLLGRDGTRVWFRHPLIRAAVLSATTTGRRRAAHAAMAEAVAADPYRQVWHQAQATAGPDDEVAARLDASHLVGLGRGSVASAVSALERAAQLTSTPDLRIRRRLLAAQHALGLGRVDLVGELLDAAAADRPGEADRARAEWLRELASGGELGNPARVRELCGLAASSAAAGETDLALDLLGSAALRCWWAAGDPADRARVVRVATGLPGVQDDPRCVAAVAVADPLGQVVATRRRLGATTAAGVRDADQLRHLGMAARAVGAEPDAADYLEAAEAQLRERGQLGLLSQVLPVLAAVYLDLGAWPRAAGALAEGHRLGEETGQSTWRTGTAAVGAVLDGLTGRSGLALRNADAIEAACDGEVAGDFRSLVQIARGAAHLSDGRPAEAYSALAPLFDPARSCHHPREQLSALAYLVEAALGCGQAAAVRGVVARMETLARATSCPVLEVHLVQVRPVLADDADAERLFRDGFAHDLTRWPWPRARLDLAYGTWLRRQRRPGDARVPLRAAVAAFDAIGARGWARQAREGLRAAGEQVPEADVGTTSTVTAQEMQIVRLAAEGLSNREIGQQLYLSPRTVGSHLYRVFPKLGVTSRSQLAARLAGGPYAPSTPDRPTTVPRASATDA